MFNTPQESIAFSLRSSKIMLHRYLDDLKPEEFQHRPCLGANNAAWIVGHLTSIDRGLLEKLLTSNLPAVQRFCRTLCHHQGCCHRYERRLWQSCRLDPALR